VREAKRPPPITAYQTRFCAQQNRAHWQQKAVVEMQLLDGARDGQTQTDDPGRSTNQD